MDVLKNGEKYKALFYAPPFAALLCGSLDFLVFTAGSLPARAVFPAVVIHLLFLLALSAVCCNIMIELFLSAFEDRENSSLRKLLYGGRRFLPIKPAVFVLIFVVLYVILARRLSNFSALRLLVLAVPAFAVFFNARYFLSGRVRLINGTYILYERGFKRILSYNVDENGKLLFIKDDGGAVETGLSITDKAFGKLEAEFQKNGLARARR